MQNKDGFDPISKKLSIILAEDDRADRLLFEEAIEELPVNIELTTVGDGEELIQWLKQEENELPDALFLDLRMPRKNGFATLGEIKRNINLQDIPVFIFSSVYEVEMIKQVFRDAAHYYIHKPIKFGDLKALLYKALKVIAEKDLSLPGKGEFLLSSDINFSSGESEDPNATPT